MRSPNYLRWTVWAAVLAIGSMNGCEKSVEEGATIDYTPISHGNPDAERPTVEFPIRCQTQDQTFNKFVQQSLQACADGDYDGFRKLFGSNFKPPAFDDFERIWKGVQSVEILSVHVGPQDPPEYYVNARVKLRQPDHRNRQERDVWVAVFKEGPEWRMAPPPSDIMRVIRELASRPASAPAPGSNQL